MFGHKTKSIIDSVIGSETRIEGDLQFQGGLRIDGLVRGRVFADPLEGSYLEISERARVEGEVRAARVVVNGEVVGPVFSEEVLELQARARITGDVQYRSLQMDGGALVSGRLAHDAQSEPVLKLAPPAKVRPA